ncbi:glycosyltransferase family 2 protein [Enterovibrio norvegicus]|uniref:glycosyltransferase family 2 protein n=1 Tax=Enterovibrio norvegicus TaxID=188144 RepID=UPI00389A6C59
MINFSVVVPTYNSQVTIAKCLESILNQSYLPCEVIVVDDFSHDMTISIVENIILNHRYGRLIKIIRKEKNSGPGVSRNLGMEVCNGDYVSFLDSDDFFSKNKLKYINDFILLKGKNVDLISDSVNQDKCFFVKNISFSKSIWKNQITTTSSVVIKKRKSRRFPNRSYSEDAMLWFDIMLSSDNCYELGKALTFCEQQRDFSKGLSSKLFRMYLGVIENYFTIYRKENISLLVLSLSVLLATAKFFIRFLKFRLIG